MELHWKRDDELSGFFFVTQPWHCAISSLGQISGLLPNDVNM